MIELNLNSTHISLYNALFLIWNECGYDTELSINRNDVMKLSKIGSANTYTKCLKDLDKAKILKYKPSHNPLIGSKINLYRFDNSTDNSTAKSSSKGTGNSTDNSSGNSIDTLYKLLNKETIKLINKQTKEFCDFVNKNSDLIFLKENNFDDLISLDDDFLNMICDYFSQTQEHLKRSVWSFLNKLKNENKLIDFKNQTIAYIDFKKISEEKKHNWKNFKYEFENKELDDFVDKLSKIQKRENKNNSVVIN
tara:strand:+ start:12494 stop:13246 length:753 start_codon:yes stop_codon:yes gene_type:complete